MELKEFNISVAVTVLQYIMIKVSSLQSNKQLERDMSFWACGSAITCPCNSLKKDSIYAENLFLQVIHTRNM